MSESIYGVMAYRLTAARLRVVATSEAEALRKAKAGEYQIIDTEPVGDTKQHRWTARKVSP